MSFKAVWNIRAAASAIFLAAADVVVADDAISLFLLRARAFVDERENQRMREKMGRFCGENFPKSGTKNKSKK